MSAGCFNCCPCHCPMTCAICRPASCYHSIQQFGSRDVEALYAALVDDEQGIHLLLHTHSLSGAYIGTRYEAGFAQAITNLTSQLTAQLTAAACLARLCFLVSMLCCVQFFLVLMDCGEVSQCGVCEHARVKDTA